MANLVIGDKVCFTTAVIARLAHDKAAAGMRGTVTGWMSSGKVALVDCGSTYTADDGRTIRAIPRANLYKVRSGAYVPDYSDLAYEDQCRDRCGL